MNKRIDNILCEKIEMYDANGTESRSNEINLMGEQNENKSNSEIEKVFVWIT